jgi:hypothetical protein
MRVVIVHNRYRSENPSGENQVVDDDIELFTNFHRLADLAF